MEKHGSLRSPLDQQLQIYSRSRRSMYILTWGYRHGIYNQYINRRVVYTQVQNDRREKHSWNSTLIKVGLSFLLSFILSGLDSHQMLSKGICFTYGNRVE